MGAMGYAIGSQWKRVRELVASGGCCGYICRFVYAQFPGIWCGSLSRIMWKKWAEFCSLLIVAPGKHIVWISAAYQVALTSVILGGCWFWDWQLGTVLPWDFSIPLHCGRNDNGRWLVTCSWCLAACHFFYFSVKWRERKIFYLPRSHKNDFFY